MTRSNYSSNTTEQQTECYTNQLDSPSSTVCLVKTFLIKSYASVQDHRLSDFAIASPPSPSLTLFLWSCAYPLVFGDAFVEGLVLSYLDWLTGGRRGAWKAMLADEEATGDAFARC